MEINSIRRFVKGGERLDAVLVRLSFSEFNVFYRPMLTSFSGVVSDLIVEHRIAQAKWVIVYFRYIGPGDFWLETTVIIRR